MLPLYGIFLQQAQQQQALRMRAQYEYQQAMEKERTLQLKRDLLSRAKTDSPQTARRMTRNQILLCGLILLIAVVTFVRFSSLVSFQNAASYLILWLLGAGCGTSPKINWASRENLGRKNLRNNRKRLILEPFSL